jgi:xylulokinase
MATAGGAIEWLRRITGGVSNETIIGEARAAQHERLTVVFLPNLIDSAPPHPEFCPLGAFLGLNAQTSRGALYRAVLEGLAMQADLILGGMTALPSITAPTTVHLIGGGTRNGLFMDIKAGVYGRPITVVDEPEATALGAALLAGVGAGLWPDLDAAVGSLDRHQHVVQPDPLLVQRYRGFRERIFEESEVALNPLNERLASLASV